MITGFQQTFKISALALAIFLLATSAGHADDYMLTLKDHQFTPATMVLPANQKVKLTVKNESAGAAEFESSDLGREKAIAPGGQVTVLVGPLSPGTYNYFDDFHRETTGTLTVR